MNKRKEQEISLLSSFPSIPKESKNYSDIKFISNQEALKSKLKQLIMKNTNISVIESIFSCIDNEQRKKKKKLNSELDSFMNKIYLKFGMVKLLQTILTLNKKDKVNEIINFDDDINNNDAKIISLASTSEDEVFLDINGYENNKRHHLHHSNKKNNQENRYNINSNSNKKYKENVVIDINDNYKDRTINLSEEEEIKEIEEIEHYSSNYLDNYPYENKNKLKKKKNKFKLSDISYHCSLIKGNYYKYKKDKLISPGNTQILFKCYNPNCKSYGIYDIIDKTFILKKPHWTGNTYLCYKHLMKEQDWNNYNYMIKNNVEEIQMYLDKK